MNPNSRTKKGKRFRFHPIKKQPLSVDSSEEQQQPQEYIYKTKLTSIASSVREDVTAYLANIVEIPAELKEIPILKLLIDRLTKQQPTVTYNALFAIKNLIQLDKAFLILFAQLNLLTHLVVLLNDASTSFSKDIGRKIIQAVYALLLTLVESVTFEQLNELDSNKQFRQCIFYIMRVLQSTTAMDNSEPVMQFLKVVSEYTTKSRMAVMEHESEYHSIERILMQAGGRLQCVACYTLLFVGTMVRPETISEMLSMYSEHVHNNNLEQQYKQNFTDKKIQPEKETDMNDEEQQIQQEQIIEQKGGNQGRLQVEKPIKPVSKAQQRPNKQSLFMESVDMANIMTQWLLSIIQKDEDIDDTEEEDEDHVVNEPSNVNAQNAKLKEMLKSKISSVEGTIRNTQLTLPAAMELVDMSWRVVQVSLQYLNYEKILSNAFGTLSNILDTQSDQIRKSITETCLAVILSIWQSHFSQKNTHLPQVFDYLIAAAERVLQGNHSEKSKMIMLELLGHRYNPQKRPVTQVFYSITQIENQRIGALLKSFMMQSSHHDMTLQCQCLDTLFDIYCNEDFDIIFRNLGMLGLAEGALTVMKGINKKSKFFRQVTQDLKRFIEYKREQMTKQNLL